MSRRTNKNLNTVEVQEEIWSMPLQLIMQIGVVLTSDVEGMEFQNPLLEDHMLKMEERFLE